MRLAPGAEERQAFRIMKYTADIVERDADAEQLLRIQQTLFTSTGGPGHRHFRLSEQAEGRLTSSAVRQPAINFYNG